jgi:hypothetical protein
MNLLTLYVPNDEFFNSKPVVLYKNNNTPRLSLYLFISMYKLFVVHNISYEQNNIWFVFYYLTNYFQSKNSP